MDACLINLKAQCSSVIPGTPVIWGGLLKTIQWPPGATVRHEAACKARIHILKKSFLRGKLIDQPQLHMRLVQFSFYWRSARSVIVPGMSEMRFDEPVVATNDVSNDSHSESYSSPVSLEEEELALEPIDTLVIEDETVEPLIPNDGPKQPLVWHPAEESGKSVSVVTKPVLPPKGRGFANVPGRASYVIQLLFAWKAYELVEEGSTGELPNPLEYRHWRKLAPTIQWHPPMPFYVRPERCQQEYKFTRTSWVHGYGLSTVLKRAIVDYSLFPPLKEIQLRMPTTRRNHNKPSSSAVIHPTSPLPLSEEKEEPVIPNELESILRDRSQIQMDKPPPHVVRRKPRFQPEEVKGSTDTPILKRYCRLVDGDETNNPSSSKHQLDLSLLQIHQSQEDAARHYSLIQRLKAMVDVVTSVTN